MGPASEAGGCTANTKHRPRIARSLQPDTDTHPAPPQPRAVRPPPFRLFPRAAPRGAPRRHARQTGLHHSQLQRRGEPGWAPLSPSVPRCPPFNLPPPPPPRWRRRTPNFPPASCCCTAPTARAGARPGAGGGGGGAWRPFVGSSQHRCSPASPPLPRPRAGSASTPRS